MPEPQGSSFHAWLVLVSSHEMNSIPVLACWRNAGGERLQKDTLQTERFGFAVEMG